jgi:hypothetical protein
MYICCKRIGIYKCHHGYSRQLFYFFLQSWVPLVIVIISVVHVLSPVWWKCNNSPSSAYDKVYQVLRW